MSWQAKVRLLVVVAASLAAWPSVASAGERSAGVLTLFRALVGQPAASQAGEARVLVVPGPFVFLGKSPEQDARDVLELMTKLKQGYGLGEVSLGATSLATVTPGKEVELAMPGGEVAVRVALLQSDAATAAYKVTLTKPGEQPNQATILVNRGERGLIGTHDGPAAPYLFLSIEPINEPERAGRNPAVMPQLIHRVSPVYPADARKARIDGVVILEATVGTDGAVHDLRALRSEPMGLTDAAIAAVRQWRYEPARDAAGKAVAATFTVTVSFVLDRSKTGPAEK